MAVTHDSLLVAKRLPECLPQGDADVLDRVVIVDVQVAGGLDVEIEGAVTRDLFEHVL